MKLQKLLSKFPSTEVLCSRAQDSPVEARRIDRYNSTWFLTDWLSPHLVQYIQQSYCLGCTVHAVQRLECGLCVSLCHLALPLCPNYLHRGCEADPHSHAGGVVAISEDLLINSLDSSLTSTLTNIHSRVRQAANIYLLLMDHEKPEVVLPRICQFVGEQNPSTDSVERQYGSNMLVDESAYEEDRRDRRGESLW